MISVVIPMYNSEKTIIPTLDSIRNQTKLSVIGEIIIVDDGSTDNSYKLVEMYSFQFSNLPIVILKKENGGVSSARNLGIKHAKYNWIALLDSDDCWLPSKIEKQIKILSENREIKFLGTNRNDERVKVGIKVSDGIYKLTIHSFLIKIWPSVPTVVFNKEIIDKVGLFNENCNHGEDADFWLRVLRNFQIFYLEESLVYTGNGKATFGDIGLSADLAKMHRGCVNLIKNAYKNKDIKVHMYFVFYIYEQLKYARRIILTKGRKILCSLKK